MIKLILLIACIGLASAQFPRPNNNNRFRAPEPRAPTYSQPTRSNSGGNPKDIQIIRSEVENNGDGTYSYRYETSDGTIVEEKGYLKPPTPGSDEPIQVAEGSYQYYSPEGELIQLQYKADENGFQPQGAHLPTPPPIPELIQKSLDLIYKGVAQQTGRQQQQQSYQAPAARFTQQQRPKDPRQNRYQY